jgi:hypothetical protein
MSYLIAVLVSLLVLASFLLFSSLETRYGFRVLAGPRRRFDRHVARATYVARHIDWSGFIAHIVKTTAERIAHDIVHTTLLVVRAVERILTRIIRVLRERVASRATDEPPVEGSQLIATIIRFRKSFKRELPPAQDK